MQVSRQQQYHQHQDLLRQQQQQQQPLRNGRCDSPGGSSIGSLRSGGGIPGSPSGSLRSGVVPGSPSGSLRSGGGLAHSPSGSICSSRSSINAPVGPWSLQRCHSSLGGYGGYRGSSLGKGGQQGGPRSLGGLMGGQASVGPRGDFANHGGPFQGAPSWAGPGGVAQRRVTSSGVQTSPVPSPRPARRASATSAPAAPTGASTGGR